MTMKQVLERGFQTRHERGDGAKLGYLNAQSAQRFCDLSWVLEARAIDLRTANRRWLRRNGYRLTGRAA